MASTRFTKRELEAINEALAFRMAGEIEDEVEPLTFENYETAKTKIEIRLFGP